MLTALQVKDFAIITHSSLELEAGMTTLTGETGAGKSILLGALGLVLGDRASPGAVRDTAERADISALFDIDNISSVSNWLSDHSMDNDGECILRRVVTRDGKSRAYINGTPVTVRNLRELGQLLVNIHGQHDHQLITLPDTQREILDDFGKNTALLTRVQKSFTAWSLKHRELGSITERLKARHDRLDTLKYQLQEFARLSLAGIDFDEIDQEHRRLSNTTQLKELCINAMDLLQDNPGSTLSQLAEAEKILVTLCQQDNSVAEIAELLNSARIQVDEATDSLRHYNRAIEPDPERLHYLDDVLSTAHQLAKKHRISLPELAAFAETLEAEFNELESIDESIESLHREVEAAAANYNKAAEKLSAKRTTAALQLSKHLTRAMQTLGMKGGKFDIEITSRKLEHPHPGGIDQVVFKVSANPGAALRAMSDVASGGELSRLSLAVQLIASERNRVPTLIFDEVDTGVGGGVAETVGQQLRQLGNRCQVLCVTHLPQVAAQGHHHIKVSKRSSDKKTLAESHTLTDEQSLEEIARMLGGVKITKRTREHAREMLIAANTAQEPESN
ncbi:DNA repair protein RecN [Chromatiales bacterium (ex Bugula neritina AB1)]|nr:DNA repair protein RecN [Chromatiales bacterium (ex Bugula neritina AB1)]